MNSQLRYIEDSIEKLRQGHLVLSAVMQKAGLVDESPVEMPPRKTGILELTDDLHICQWSDDLSHKWTIAVIQYDKEGPEWSFIGDRPFDSRVDWSVFKELLAEGQGIAQRRFDDEY